MHSYYAGPKFRFLFPEGNNVISVVSLWCLLYLFLFSISFLHFWLQSTQFKQDKRIITASEAC